MNNITVQYFLSLFDEFSRVQPDRIEAYITVASTRVCPKVWCQSTQYATALLTAHMLTAQGRKNGGHGAGGISQETVGDLSRTFAQTFDVTRGDSQLLTTRYGIDYVQLRKETFVSAMTTGWPGPRC